MSIYFSHHDHQIWSSLIKRVDLSFLGQVTWFSTGYNDTISISGHDRETIVAFEETPEFKAFNEIFDIIENEYRNDVEEVQL